MVQSTPLVNLVFEASSLRQLVRAHRQQLFTPDINDNIAAHSYLVSFIGLLLADQEGADSGKVVKMCLIHDFAEARCNDANWINKKHQRVDEPAIIQSQLSPLSTAPELIALYQEYEEESTLESKIAKDADLLDEIILLREYAHTGNHEAEDWLKEEPFHLMSRFRTVSAQNLAKQILETSPGNWWKQIWSDTLASK
jgi:putative hydrolase of HD superfamily